VVLVQCIRLQHAPLVTTFGIVLVAVSVVEVS